MSRYYRNETVLELSRKATSRDRKVAIAAYSDEWKHEDCDVTDDEIVLSGESSLCGGESENAAHERITKRMRQAFPGCRVTTRWTYLEDLPCEEYVSEPEEKNTPTPWRQGPAGQRRQRWR